MAPSPLPPPSEEEPGDPIARSPPLPLPAASDGGEGARKLGMRDAPAVARRPATEGDDASPAADGPDDVPASEPVEPPP